MACRAESDVASVRDHRVGVFRPFFFTPRALGTFFFFLCEKARFFAKRFVGTAQELALFFDSVLLTNDCFFLWQMCR